MQTLVQYQLLVGLHLVDTINRGEVWHGFKHSWLLIDELQHGNDGVSKALKLCLGIRLSRFNHQALCLGKRNGRGMIAKVEEQFAKAPNGFGTADPHSFEPGKSGLR